MYERKAKNFDATDTRKRISSDDPYALERLRARLMEVENVQDTMEAANIAIRQENTRERRIAVLKALGYEPDTVERLLEPDAGRIGFRDDEFANLSRNIRRIRKRIAELENAAARQGTEEVTDQYIYREAENRIMFFLKDTPTQEFKVALMGLGFKWSSTRNAWIQRSTDSGHFAALHLKKSLTQWSRHK